MVVSKKSPRRRSPEAWPCTEETWQVVPDWQMGPSCIGLGVSWLTATEGAAVLAPTTVALRTYQGPFCLLEGPSAKEWNQVTAKRPSLPALIHGHTYVPLPVEVPADGFVLAKSFTCGVRSMTQGHVLPSSGEPAAHRLFSSWPQVTQTLPAPSMPGSLMARLPVSCSGTPRTSLQVRPASSDTATPGPQPTTRWPFDGSATRSPLHGTSPRSSHVRPLSFEARRWWS